jgi:hypothetical protein
MNAHLDFRKQYLPPSFEKVEKLIVIYFNVILIEIRNILSMRKG